MSLRARFRSHLWLFALVSACAFGLWLTVVRVQRVEFVTNLVPTDAVVDPSSATGYAHGLRQLIVPEPNSAACQWIVQTQQMLARGEWRVRHEDYDNAPVGREVLSASPYRWWLGLVSWVDHALFGTPLGLAVERAALVADPILQLLLLVGIAWFVARRFGGLPAAICSVAGVTLYPVAGLFLPGQPNDAGLAALCACWSVLLLLAGIDPRVPAENPSTERPGACRRRWFAGAGVVGGVGVWIKPGVEVPVVVGIALGGVLVAWLTRRTTRRNGVVAGAALPWRTWALTGAATCLVAFFVEYFPGHLGGWHLEQVHPLYGLAWLGLGEWLARLTARIENRPTKSLARSLPVLFLAAAPIVAFVMLLFHSGRGELLFAEGGSTRLTNMAGSPVEPDLWAWIRHDGWSLKFVATSLPLLATTAVAGWLLGRRTTRTDRKAAVLLALGPVLAAFALGCVYLSWWSALDVSLVVLLAVIVPTSGQGESGAFRRLAGTGLLVLGLIPGMVVLASQARADLRKTVTEGEVEALIDRDLAQWLANAAGDKAVVLAPPTLTTSLYFNGGLAGLGTLDVENKAGLRASIRIAGASSADEAQALALGRHLKYIVMPSWDDSLDEYARLGANQHAHSLIALLHRWLPPRWLRPVPYHLPKVTGFEGQSVAIFEVVDVQSNATALSRLAEYFVEMGQIGKAMGVAYTLAHSFPTDLGAAVARALVAHAAGESAAFQTALRDVQAGMARGQDRALLWDQRVSLAIALAEGKRFESARAQVQHCLADVTEERLRSLTTVSLYRLRLMNRAFGLRIADPRLRALAQSLLPRQMREPE